MNVYAPDPLTVEDVQRLFSLTDTQLQMLKGILLLEPLVNPSIGAWHVYTQQIKYPTEPFTLAFERAQQSGFDLWSTGLVPTHPQIASQYAFDLASGRRKPSGSPHLRP